MTVEKILLASADGHGTRLDGYDMDHPSISANGRYVAFSQTTGFGDVTLTDIIVKDLQTGALRRADEDQYYFDHAYVPEISADGRHVVFASNYSGNGEDSVWIKGFVTGDLCEVEDWVTDPSISGNGRFVAFEEGWFAFNEEVEVNVTVMNLADRSVVVASTNEDGNEGNGSSGSPSMSGDGRRVAFTSTASNLVPNDTNDEGDVFVKDLEAGDIVRASTGASGNQATGESRAPSLSSDASHVGFESDASDLVPDDTNDHADIFVKNLNTGAIVRASTDALGNEANGNSWSPSVSADGRYVAFASDADNLVPDDGNDASDVFIKDLQTGDIVRASTDALGNEGNRESLDPSISGNGHTVAFTSYASNLVASDDNGWRDIFVATVSFPSSPPPGNTIDGTSGDDMLVGTSEDETILGHGGNDTLVGHKGEDCFDGGDGKDTVDYRYSKSNTLMIDLEDDQAIFKSSGVTETLTSIENATGSRGDNKLYGDDGKNVLDGHKGDDLIDGRGGRDTLIGGCGDDTLMGGRGTDSFDGGCGSDTVDYSYSKSNTLKIDLKYDFAVFKSSGIRENLSSIENAIGSRGNTVLKGDDGNNVLTGNEGDDCLYGRGGDDTLIGGGGNNRLKGGGGEDTFIFMPDQGSGSSNLPSGDVDWVQWKVEDGGNGHWYAVVHLPNITWLEARDAAEALAPGTHLATITSARENDFAWSLSTDVNEVWRNGWGPWLGGFQAEDALEPDGNWQWVTGEPWDYRNWDTAQPDDESGDEDFLHYWSDEAPVWNDLYRSPDNVDSKLDGYIAEVSFPIFTPGTDTVTDFKPGEDMVDLKAFGFEDIDAVIGRVRQEGNNVVLDLTDVGGPEVTFLDVDLSETSPDDLLL